MAKRTIAIICGVVIVVLFAFLLLVQSLKGQAPKPPEPVKFALSKEEEFHKRALRDEFTIIQTQIQQALEKHNQEVATFVAETLAAHGNPKNVIWDSMQYDFKVQEPAKEDSKPSVSNPTQKEPEKKP